MTDANTQEVLNNQATAPKAMLNFSSMAEFRITPCTQMLRMSLGWDGEGVGGCCIVAH